VATASAAAEPMFDIGFAELLIIALVSLIVIGPERLPETVRTVSAWINRFRRSFNDIKREVQLELHNDAVLRDLQKTSSDMRSQLDELKDLGRLDAIAPPPATAAADNPPSGIDRSAESQESNNSTAGARDTTGDTEKDPGGGTAATAASRSGTSEQGS